MKIDHCIPLLTALIGGLTLSGPTLGALNTLAGWGDAAGTTPPAAFTVNGGTIAITGGGADFWGNSDQGVFLWDNTGASTTTGNFTATVRHVSTTTPAPEWGRDGIIVRATQTAGTPAANDAHWLAHRKSNGQYVTGRRPTPGAETFRATDIGNPAVNYDSDTNAREVPTGNLTNTPVFISAGREGNRLHSGMALDLGGVPGRWVEHWSTDVPAAISGLQGGAQVIVGLAHQSHPQTISPDTNDINTATFDNWTYAGTYSAAKFGPPAGPTTWQLGGNVAITPATGAVTGAAYVQEGGVATGENVKWTIQAFESSTFVGRFDLAGSVKNPKGMEVADLVPAANFRHAVAATFEPGLKADIYFHANDGNFTALNTYITGNPADGTTILPRIHWSHPDYGVGYPPNGMGGDLFSDAIPAWEATGDGQENYGVNLTGQIFIPADADRVSMALPGPELLLFQDGVDDFCYLQIDGRVLINDNNWTGNASTENGGGNIAMLNVSNAKYDDGEWVSFRMIAWEGGGGDTASLYWNAFDTNGTFGIAEVPKVAGSIGDIAPIVGLAGSRKNPTAMAVADLVPTANFRYDNGGTFEPGLKADIYLQNNQGNLGAFDTIVAGGAPDGTAILPRIHWSYTNPPYPPNVPANASNKFADAVPGSFAPGSNQENYGVNMTGQIFIPADAARHALTAPGGDSLIAFKDGADDFCYLEIDGVALINDNDWTGNTTVDNGGGNIALFDASAAKYDDGEWVPFRMVMWEGGGGDNVSLYWSALDTNNTITGAQIPGRFIADRTFGGTTQVGSHTTGGTFTGPLLPAGAWVVQLTVENTGASFTKFTSATVTAVTLAPPEITTSIYNPATTVLNLTFSSQAGSNYALEYSTGFLPAGAPTSALKWNTVPGYASIAGAAGTTAITPLNTSTLLTPGGQLPDNSQSYFRIRRL